MLKIINNDKSCRPFKVIVGLGLGFSESNKGTKPFGFHDAERMIGKWLESQRISGMTYLPGLLDYNTLEYVNSKGKAVAEPALLYEGEIDPFYCAGISDEKIIKALIELASILAEKLKKTRARVIFCDKLFILGTN